jgi:hypothetical protein
MTEGRDEAVILTGSLVEERRARHTNCGSRSLLLVIERNGGKGVDWKPFSRSTLRRFRRLDNLSPSLSLRLLDLHHLGHHLLRRHRGAHTLSLSRLTAPPTPSSSTGSSSKPRGEFAFFPRRLHSN